MIPYTYTQYIQHVHVGDSQYTSSNGSKKQKRIKRKGRGCRYNNMAGCIRPSRAECTRVPVKFYTTHAAKGKVLKLYRRI